MTAAQRKKNRKSVSVSVSIQISLSLALSLSLSLSLSLATSVSKTTRNTTHACWAEFCAFVHSDSNQMPDSNHEKAVVRNQQQRETNQSSAPTHATTTPAQPERSKRHIHVCFNFTAGMGLGYSRTAQEACDAFLTQRKVFEDRLKLHQQLRAAGDNRRARMAAQTRAMAAAASAATTTTVTGATTTTTGFHRISVTTAPDSSAVTPPPSPLAVHPQRGRRRRQGVRTINRASHSSSVGRRTLSNPSAASAAAAKVAARRAAVVAGSSILTETERHHAESIAHSSDASLSHQRQVEQAPTASPSSRDPIDAPLHFDSSNNDDDNGSDGDSVVDNDGSDSSRRSSSAAADVVEQTEGLQQATGEARRRRHGSFPTMLTAAVDMADRPRSKVDTLSQGNQPHQLSHYHPHPVRHSVRHRRASQPTPLALIPEDR